MKHLALTTLLLATWVCRGQGYDAQWALGDNESVLDFRTLDTIKSYSIPTFEYFTLTNASICDSEANLLYYTNGISICGVNDSLSNGSGLSPCTYTDQYVVDGLNIKQAALFLPRPGTPGYYYLLHFSNDIIDSNLPGTLYYTLIKDTGIGLVEKKNVVFGNGIFRQGGMPAWNRRLDNWNCAQQRNKFRRL